jgi:hypothetical protein
MTSPAIIIFIVIGLTCKPSSNFLTLSVPFIVSFFLAQVEKSCSGNNSTPHISAVWLLHLEELLYKPICVGFRVRPEQDYPAGTGTEPEFGSGEPEAELLLRIPIPVDKNRICCMNLRYTRNLNQMQPECGKYFSN